MSSTQRRPDLREGKEEKVPTNIMKWLDPHLKYSTKLKKWIWHFPIPISTFERTASLRRMLSESGLPELRIGFAGQFAFLIDEGHDKGFRLFFETPEAIFKMYNIDPAKPEAIFKMYSIKPAKNLEALFNRYGGDPSKLTYEDVRDQNKLSEEFELAAESAYKHVLKPEVHVIREKTNNSSLSDLLHRAARLDNAMNTVLKGETLITPSGTPTMLDLAHAQNKRSLDEREDAARSKKLRPSLLPSMLSPSSLTWSPLSSSSPSTSSTGPQSLFFLATPTIRADALTPIEKSTLQFLNSLNLSGGVWVEGKKGYMQEFLNPLEAEQMRDAFEKGVVKYFRNKLVEGKKSCVSFLLEGSKKVLMISRGDNGAILRGEKSSNEALRFLKSEHQKLVEKEAAASPVVNQSISVSKR